jgi:hypothetical protein
MVLACVLAALSVIAAGQQIAVWTTNAGWFLVGSLALGTIGCAAAGFRQAGEPA